MISFCKEPLEHIAIGLLKDKFTLSYRFRKERLRLQVF